MPSLTNTPGLSSGSDATNNSMPSFGNVQPLEAGTIGGGDQLSPPSFQNLTAIPGGTITPGNGNATPVDPIHNPLPGNGGCGTGPLYATPDCFYEEEWCGGYGWNANGGEIWYFLTCGEFYYAVDNEYVGGILPDGIIYNQYGDFIGKLDTLNGSLYDRFGTYVGRVDKDGRAYNRFNQYFGQASASGKVYGRHGELLGSFSNISCRVAAVYWFFFDLLKAGVMTTGATASPLTNAKLLGKFFTSKDSLAGYINSDLRFYNKKGSFMGRIKEGDKMYDTKDLYIGVIDSVTGKVRDKNGSELGELRTDGKVYSAMGTYMGEIKTTGEIYDRTGRLLGRSKDVPAKYSALLYFFLFEPNKW